MKERRGEEKKGEGREREERKKRDKLSVYTRLSGFAHLSL